MHSRRLIRSLVAFVVTAGVTGLTAQVSPKPTAEFPVTVHERLNDSCELVENGKLLQYKKFAAIELEGVAGELYSPEFGESDFIALAPATPEDAAKAARKSGFDVRLLVNEGGRLPSVAALGSGSCPELDNVVRMIATQRNERHSQIQSRTYQVGKDVLPPEPIKQNWFRGNTETSKTADSGEKPKVRNGTVALMVLIDKDGTVRPLKVVQPLDPVLDKKAAQTVQEWKFSPARKQGLPVPVQMRIEVNFRLEN